MAIKRVIYEIDDSPGEAAPTDFPESLRAIQQADYQPRQLTGSPAVNDTEDTQQREWPPESPVRHGRTYSDLVAEFQHSPRAMATVLTIVGFVPFVMRLQKFEDIIMPLTISAILNAVWFGVPFLIMAYKWVAKIFCKRSLPHNQS